jgi:hypothetical protein
MSRAKQPPKYALLKRLALALPGTSEEFSRGFWFNVGSKTFVCFWIAEERWIMKLPKDRQMELFEVRPETFAPMTHGRLRWSYVKVEDLSAAELRDLITDAWRTVATRKLQSALVE